MATESPSGNAIRMAARLTHSVPASSGIRPYCGGRRGGRIPLPPGEEARRRDPSFVENLAGEVGGDVLFGQIGDHVRMIGHDPAQTLRRAAQVGSELLLGRVARDVVEPEDQNRVVGTSYLAPVRQVGVEYLHDLFRSQALHRVRPVDGQHVALLDGRRVEQTGSLAEQEDDDQYDHDTGQVAARHQDFLGDGLRYFSRFQFHGFR